MNKLNKIALVFIGNWVLGQVCQSTYQQNITWCVFATLAYAIFTGMHQDLWKAFKNEVGIHFG